MVGVRREVGSGEDGYGLGRTAHIDHMILACLVLGLSTRKAATTHQPMWGRRTSADAVSQAVHRWSLTYFIFRLYYFTEYLPAIVLRRFRRAR